MSIFDIDKRPLPSFKDWIEARSPGMQADDFEFFADLARRTELDCEHLKPREASFARMRMGALVAAVELCNMEAMKYRRPRGEIITTLPSIFAIATMLAVASVCKPETPFRQIAKVMTKEFRAAAKRAADVLTEQNEDAE